MAVPLLGGLLSATLAVLPLTGLPGLVLFSYLTCLPLFLVGLSLGLRSLLVAGFVASLILFFIEGPLLTGEYFLFSFLGPTFLVSRLLLNRTKKNGVVEWYPPSLLLRDFTLTAGFVMLIALTIYFYFTEGGDPHTLLKPLIKVYDTQEQIKDLEPLLLRLFPILPGIFTLSWSIMMLINGSLAQGLLIRFKQNLRPPLSSYSLDASKGLYILLALSMILTVVGLGSLEIIGKNAIFVLIIPFFMIGLRMSHSWIMTTRSPTLGLTLFYTILLLLLWPLLLIILLGIVKPLIEKLKSPN